MLPKQPFIPGRWARLYMVCESMPQELRRCMGEIGEVLAVSEDQGRVTVRIEVPDSYPAYSIEYEIAAGWLYPVNNLRLPWARLPLEVLSIRIGDQAVLERTAEWMPSSSRALIGQTAIIAAVAPRSLLATLFFKAREDRGQALVVAELSCFRIVRPASSPHKGRAEPAGVLH